MKKLLYIFVIATLILGSCKKEPYVTPVNGEVQFSYKGTLNGDPFTLNAGAENIYLGSALEQNSFGVYEFSSNFSDLSCQGCDPFLSIRITNDILQEIDAAVDPQALQTGNLFFATHENSSDYLTLHFHANFDPESQYSWDFGDGQNGTGHNPDHTFSAAGVYQVVLTVDDEGNDNDIVFTQSVLVGDPSLISMPFHLNNLPGNEWEFSYPDFLPDYLEILNWTINGVDFYSDNLHLNLEDDVDACLHFHNTLNDTNGSYCMSFSGDVPGSVYSGISYQWNGSDLNLGKVDIHYRDADGHVYTSYSNLNAVNNLQFQILSVEEYQAGINAHAAKKIKASFSAYLINQDDPNDILLFENVTAELGFVYE